MGCIIELIIDVFFDGLIEGAVNKKVPLILRIVCGIILFLVYGALIALFVSIFLRENSIGFRIFLGLLILLFLLGFVLSVIKLVKRQDP